MKKNLACVVVVFTTAVLILPWKLDAQVFQKMSFQAVVRNAGNDLVKNTQIGIRILIIQDSATGPSVYTETLTPITNSKGLISIEIGGGAGFDTINWSNGPYFLKTETDIAGGTNYTLSGTSQILSVPYALYAKIAETANNMNRLEERIFEMEVLSGIGLITDINGSNYHVIKLGDQYWITENLHTRTYNDGTPIPLETNNANWSSLTTPAYCWYNNDSISYAGIYGALYNWFAVETGKLCPTGWHVPAQDEWTALTTYLTNNGYGYGGSGSDVAKSIADTSGWQTHITAGTVGNNQQSNNSTDFTAVPASLRQVNGSYESIEILAAWWSSTMSATSNAYGRVINYSSGDVMLFNGDKKYGLSVRCIKSE